MFCDLWLDVRSCDWQAKGRRVTTIAHLFCMIAVRNLKKGTSTCCFTSRIKVDLILKHSVGGIVKIVRYDGGACERVHCQRPQKEDFCT